MPVQNSRSGYHWEHLDESRPTQGTSFRDFSCLQSLSPLLCTVLYCVNSGSERAIVLGLLFTWLNLFKSTAEMFGFSPLGFGLYFNWRVCLVPGNIFFSTLNAWPIQILKVDFIIPGGERLKLSRLLARFPFHFGLCCKELRSLSPEALYSLSWLVFLDSRWDPGWPITVVNLSDSFLGTVSG